MNWGNIKTSDPRRLALNLAGKLDLKKIDKYIALSDLSIWSTWKNVKNS